MRRLSPMSAVSEQVAIVAERIHLSGTVQGVGLRPYIARLARAHGINGYVANDTGGLVIMARAAAAQIDALITDIVAAAPAPARIDAVQRRRQAPAATALPAGFTIRASQGGPGFTGIAADAATCPACLADINDPGNRRYRYPFTNCTRCGPRYTLIDAIPYDRAGTSMSAFTMCPLCRSEYTNPADRRYHAQTNACPACGPQLWLEDHGGNRVAIDGDGDCLTTAARLLRSGAIIAIKGLGGIHLACDAGNSDAIARLRRAKRRPHKALALMARDVAMVSDYAAVDESARALLQQPAAPVVILPAVVGNGLPGNVAPGQSTLGFMLPYTPLHHLLLQAMQRPLVMTSGNRHSEPLIIDNDSARQCLSASADYLLLHDRDILQRSDDSVVRIMAGAPRLLRRARGYAPQALTLPAGFDRHARVLAMGGQQKNTFCLVGQGQAILSPHIGDLDGADTYRDYRRQLNGFCRLFSAEPATVVVDRHPDYLLMWLGERLATDSAADLIRVQHHHAHIAAVMAEHGLPLDTPAVLGIALDGAGYGDDGTIWGGEFLLAGYADYSRVARFQPVPLPGGATASREPWRNTFAQLATLLDWERIATAYAGVDGIRFLQRQPLSVLQTMMSRGFNSPLTSSAGRLVDAVAAFIGVRRRTTSYEGQAAMELEALAALADPGLFSHGRGYGYTLGENRIGWAPLWSGLLDDSRDGVAREVMAARFHQTLVDAVSDMALRLRVRHRFDTVVLGGGVLQNRLLLQGLEARLRQQGTTVLTPRRFPANDGALALGQAAVAVARVHATRCHSETVTSADRPDGEYWP